ncbi:MAG: hypothetical protein IJ756_03365 [Paludibacteraceae bacterium]|nr:hypothetical protein [Paludibacteraceae bacterium]MBR1786185.1 hypothetical protein [Paludibacteraceae bacterium]
MINKRHITTLFFLLSFLFLQAQTEKTDPSDNDEGWHLQSKQKETQDKPASLVLQPTDTLREVKPPFKPDPVRAVWLASILPGAGQIYNRSYWKLPIVYGGIMGCIYAITWNNSKYLDYKAAYRDILIDDGIHTAYLDVLPKGYTVETMGGKSTYTSTLKNQQNVLRRYRDLSIVGLVAVYALSIVDAYVDAHLFDFDISEDLSMHLQPDFHYDPALNHSGEITLAIRF